MRDYAMIEAWRRAPYFLHLAQRLGYLPATETPISLRKGTAGLPVSTA